MGSNIGSKREGSWSILRRHASGLQARSVMRKRSSPQRPQLQECFVPMKARNFESACAETLFSKGLFKTNICCQAITNDAV